MNSLQTQEPQLGFTLLELLISLTLIVILLGGMNQLSRQLSMGALEIKSRNQQMKQLEHAFMRIERSLERGNGLLVPRQDDPATAHNESIRTLVAVGLDPQLDRNGDGFADADNDADGLVDEDLPADYSNDGAAGIVGLDDDGDGIIDGAGGSSDNDEDGVINEDWQDGIDNDADGSTDEDPGSDMDSPVLVDADDDLDGSTDEDWIDVVAFYLQGTQIIERRPRLGAADGNDFDEFVLLDAVNSFQVSLLSDENSSWQLISVSISVTDQAGANYSLSKTFRIGSRL
jgi:prepilin-type N-terminal cleavage/methylation domain-containing protein